MPNAAIGLPCIGLRFSERAGGWNPLACNAGLSPRSCRLNIVSRAGRVMPLPIMGVDAPESCAAMSGELRVVPRKGCLSSRFIGMMGFFVAIS